MGDGDRLLVRRARHPGLPPHLEASGDGQLANVSSIFGIIAVQKQSAYNAAKFAVRGFTEARRQECRLDGTPVSVATLS